MASVNPYGGLIQALERSTPHSNWRYGKGGKKLFTNFFAGKLQYKTTSVYWSLKKHRNDKDLNSFTSDKEQLIEDLGGYFQNLPEQSVDEQRNKGVLRRAILNFAQNRLGFKLTEIHQKFPFVQKTIKYDSDKKHFVKYDPKSGKYVKA